MHADVPRMYVEQQITPYLVDGDLHLTIVWAFRPKKKIRFLY